MVDGPVPEISIFSKQLAVVCGNRDVGVLGNSIEELLYHAVEVFDGCNLTLPKLPQFAAVEELILARSQFAAHQLIIQMLKDAVHSANPRPSVRRLIRQSIGIMRFPHVQQEEIGLLLRELHLPNHGPHVVVLLHELIAVKAGVEDRLRVQNGQRNHRMSPIAQGVVQESRQEQLRDQRFEFDILAAQALVELQDILLIILRSINVAGAGMRHQSDQQVVMRRRRPGSIGPPSFDLS